MEELPKKIKYAKTIFSRLKRIVILPEHARVLDVGAGAGEFLIACTELGHYCEGIEPCKDARINAIKLSEYLRTPINIFGGQSEAPIRD